MKLILWYLQRHCKAEGPRMRLTGYLRDAVAALFAALHLVLRPELQLLLFLLEVHQVPLVLQTRLPPLPQLQEQSDCREHHALPLKTTRGRKQSMSL